MKNLVILFAGCFLALSLSAGAQEKVTKDKVIGSWGLSAVEMKDMFYYDIDKDSLELGTALKAQLGDNQGQLELVKSVTKSQLAMLKNVFFRFNTDGTTEFNSGDKTAKQGTYTVDEEKSTITTVDKTEQKDKATLPASLVDGKLKMTLSQAEGEFIMLLKKK